MSRCCLAILTSALAASTLAAQPPRTDRYGDPLPPGVIARLGTVRLRSSYQFDSVTFTPDGRHLVSGGTDGAVFWDVRTGKEIRRLPTELPHMRHRAVLSPDGKRIAVTGDLAGGAVYDVATGRRLFLYGSQSQGMVCFAPGGAILAAYGGDPEIALYDVATGKYLRAPLTGHAPTGNFGVNAAVAGAAFTPDGKTLISCGGADGIIRSWDVASGKEQRPPISSKDEIRAFVLSPDGRLAATQAWLHKGSYSTSANRIRIWDVTAGKEIRRIEVPAKGDEMAPPTGGLAAFTPDGKALVTATIDGTLHLWDPQTGEVLRRIAGAGRPPNGMAFAPDGKTFAVIEPWYALRVRDFATGRDLVDAEGHWSVVQRIAVSPDGQTVATGGWDRPFRLWDLHSGKALGRLSGHDNIATLLAFAPNGRSLHSANSEHLAAWDPHSGKELHRSTHTARGQQWVYGALSHDGRLTALSAPQKTLTLWDTQSGKDIRKLAAPDRQILTLAFAPDDRTLIGWGGPALFPVGYWYRTAPGQDVSRIAR